MGAALSGWAQRVVIGRVRGWKIHVPWNGDRRDVRPGFTRPRLPHVVRNGRIQTDRRAQLYRGAGVRRRGARARRGLHRDQNRRLSEFRVFDRRQHSTAPVYVLITAKSVLALATSYANGTSAWSEADGSTLLSLVIAGIAYPDGAPDPNTRVELPGVGYAVLNEQIARGDGLQSAGLTVNMIHVYLLDPVSGAAAGEIVVGAATSTATL